MISTLKLLKSHFHHCNYWLGLCSCKETARAKPKPLCHLPAGTTPRCTNTATALRDYDSAQKDDLPRFSCSEQHICSFPLVIQVPPELAANSEGGASHCTTRCSVPTPSFTSSLHRIMLPSPSFQTLQGQTDQQQSPKFFRHLESYSLLVELLPH